MASAVSFASAGAAAFVEAAGCVSGITSLALARTRRLGTAEYQDPLPLQLAFPLPSPLPLHCVGRV
jgi:hypothetical protein